nr:MAG TPA: hypothetical protein [Caudoviricetes sp.]
MKASCVLDVRRFQYLFQRKVCLNTIEGSKKDKQKHT